MAFALGNRISALLFFDIDGFSYVNAKYGVAIGEEIITTIDELLRENAPVGAYVARWNADEFVCVVPGFADREALECAKGLVSLVNNNGWERIDDNLFLSISCGVCSYRRRRAMKEVEWVEAAILGARTVKVKGGGDTRIGARINSTPAEVARKVRAPLDYLDLYGS